MNKELKSFIKYCEKNPKERFWQALRNWSGEPFIYASNLPMGEIEIPPEANSYINDTFFWGE